METDDLPPHFLGCWAEWGYMWGAPDGLRLLVEKPLTGLHYLNFVWDENNANTDDHKHADQFLPVVISGFHHVDMAYAGEDEARSQQPQREVRTLGRSHEIRESGPRKRKAVKTQKENRRSTKTQS